MDFETKARWLNGPKIDDVAHLYAEEEPLHSGGNMSNPKLPEHLQEQAAANHRRFAQRCRIENEEHREMLFSDLEALLIEAAHDPTLKAAIAKRLTDIEHAVADSFGPMVEARKSSDYAEGDRFFSIDNGMQYVYNGSEWVLDDGGGE